MRCLLFLMAVLAAGPAAQACAIISRLESPDAMVSGRSVVAVEIKGVRATGRSLPASRPPLHGGTHPAVVIDVAVDTHLHGEPVSARRVLLRADTPQWLARDGIVPGARVVMALGPSDQASIVESIFAADRKPYCPGGRCLPELLQITCHYGRAIVPDTPEARLVLMAAASARGATP